MFKNKRILVTGGAGSIGAMLVRLLAPHNQILIFDLDDTRGYDLAESLQYKGYDVKSVAGDVRDVVSVDNTFAGFQPQIVFHCAALKTVPSGERQQREYVMTNVVGTLNILEASAACQVKIFVMVSSDKAAGPTSIMGGTKLMAELLAKKGGGIVVRFGNVLGSQGSIIPLWQGQIDRGEPMTITDPACERYFMTIEEACKLVIRSANQGNPGETFILDMGRRVRIGDLAQQIIENTRQSIETKTIGLRSGETLIEKLMTEEEQKRAVKKGDFYVF